MMTLASNAQDFHHSQFYFAHYNLNPALTGKIQQDFRFFGIHRSQWYKVGSQFNTTGLAFDMNFKGEKLGDNIIGLGVYGVNDDFENGYFKEQELGLALAWHRPLDGLNRNIISFGAQGSYGQKSILGPEELLWSSEFDQFERPNDGTTNAGEEYAGGPVSSMRVNIGAGWSYEVWEGFNLSLGVAAFNANKPKETYFSNFSGKGERENWRNVMNLGIKYKFNEVLSLHPSMMLMTQSGATNLIYGSFLGYSPASMQNKNVTLYVGPWFRGGWGDRSKDAFILASALEIAHYRLGMSYDFTVSNLNNLKDQAAYQDAGQIGSFEISFTYVGFLKRGVPSDYTIPCKFF